MIDVSSSLNPDFSLPPSIMATVRRLAKASGKTEEVFLRQYLIECMKEENEALENYNNSNKTQPKNTEPGELFPSEPVDEFSDLVNKSK